MPAYIAMFEAQYLFENEPVYSPWMSRSGDNLRVTLDLVANSDTAKNLVVGVYEKNSEDTGDGSPVDASLISEGMPGVYTGDLKNAVKELVRYRITYGTASGSDRALFRMLAPVWFDSVKA